MRAALILLALLIAACSPAPAKERGGGYIVPRDCGDRWVCADDPLCEVEEYRFLCEPWGTTKTGTN